MAFVFFVKLIVMVEKKSRALIEWQAAKSSNIPIL